VDDGNSIPILADNSYEFSAGMPVSSSAAGIYPATVYVNAKLTGETATTRYWSNFTVNVLNEFGVDNFPPAAPPSSNLTGSATVGTTAAVRVATKSSTLALGGTAENNATIKVYVTTDGGANWTATSTTATATSVGNWSIASFDLSGYAGQTIGLAVSATDSAGNESTKTLYGYLLYDSTAPSVTISSPTSSSTTDQSSVTITGTVAFDSWETASGITLTLQTGRGSVSVPITSSAAGSGTFTYDVTLNEGANTIIVRATDSLADVGDPSTIMVTRTVTSWATYAIVVVIIAPILAVIGVTTFRKKSVSIKEETRKQEPIARPPKPVPKKPVAPLRPSARAKVPPKDDTVAYIPVMCPKCNHPNLPHVKYCAECGRKLGEKTS
jgi:hypothetical protein